MVWLIDGAAAGQLRGLPAAAVAGWWFGFGYFVPGLYWIGYAFLVDAQTFGWLLPFAVCGLPAYLALFTAFGFALARLIWTRDASRVLALAASLTVERMAARPCPHRLSLERIRLCADRAAGAGAKRVPDRPVGPDIPGGCDLRQPGGADRWTLAGAPAVDRAGHGAGAACGDGHLRHGPPGAAADGAGRQRQAAASCSPTCSRTSASTIPPRPR